MRKSIYLIGALTLAVATIAVWSQNAPVSSRVNTALAATVASGTPSAAAMSPSGMMAEYNQPLPAERWDLF
jgi:hypothetical protein